MAIRYKDVKGIAGMPVSNTALNDNPELNLLVNPDTQTILNPEDKNPITVVAPGGGPLQTKGTGKWEANPIGKQGLLPDDSLAQDIVNGWRLLTKGKQGKPTNATEIIDPDKDKIIKQPEPIVTKTQTETDTGPDILGIIGKTLNDPAVAQLLGRAISGIGKGTDNTTPELMTQNAIIGQVGKRMREDELLDRKDLQAQLDRENDLKKISSKPQAGGNDEPDFWVKQRVKSLQDNIFNNPTWTQDALITQALIANKMNPKEVKGLSLQQKQRALARAQGMGDEYDMLVRGQGVGTTQQPSQPQGQPAQAAPGAVPPGMKIQKNKKTGEIRYVPI